MLHFKERVTGSGILVVQLFDFRDFCSVAAFKPEHQTTDIVESAKKRMLLLATKAHSPRNLKRN